MLKTSLHIFVLWSSGIGRKSGALIVRYSQKNKLWILFVFYCFENPSVAHDCGTTGAIQVGFWAKCTSLNEAFNQIETWKCYMVYFRLISLDCITYCCLLHPACNESVINTSMLMSINVLDKKCRLSFIPSATDCLSITSTRPQWLMLYAVSRMQRHQRKTL